MSYIGTFEGNTQEYTPLNLPQVSGHILRAEGDVQECFLFSTRVRCLIPAIDSGIACTAIRPIARQSSIRQQSTGCASASFYVFFCRYFDACMTLQNPLRDLP